MTATRSVSVEGGGRAGGTHLPGRSASGAGCFGDSVAVLDDQVPRDAAVRDGNPDRERRRERLDGGTHDRAQMPDRHGPVAVGEDPPHLEDVALELLVERRV